MVLRRLREPLNVERVAYEKLLASSPRPQPAGYYRKILLQGEDPTPSPSPSLASLDSGEGGPRSVNLTRDPWRLAQFWALVAAFVGLEWVVVTRPEWWLWPIASVFLGLILVSLFALLHELMHYAIVRNRGLAWLHGWIAGFYSGLTPDSWKDEHDAHHASLGRPGEDPDAVYDLEAWRKLPGVRRAILFLPGAGTVLGVMTRPFWWMAVHAQMLFVRYVRLERVPAWRKALAVGVWVFDVGAQLALIAVLGRRYALFGFLVPVVIQNVLLTYFLLGTHLTSPRTEELDPVLGSVSVRMGPLLGLFFLDAGRHVEHHLFPGTSHRKLAPITERLKEKFADRYCVVPFAALVVALERTGRVYVGHDLLWNPTRDRYSTPYRHLEGKLTPPAPLAGAS